MKENNFKNDYTTEKLVVFLSKLLISIVMGPLWAVNPLLKFRGVLK